MKAVTAREVRLLQPLDALRALPGLVARRPAFRPNPSARLIDEFTIGVVPLGERVDVEIAAGAIGRFWRLVGNQPADVRTREDFISFAEPGYAKVRRSRSWYVLSAAVAMSSPRRASCARAPRQREHCCATGVGYCRPYRFGHGRLRIPPAAFLGIRKVIAKRRDVLPGQILRHRLHHRRPHYSNSRHAREPANDLRSRAA